MAKLTNTVSEKSFAMLPAAEFLISVSDVKDDINSAMMWLCICSTGYLALLLCSYLMGICSTKKSSSSSSSGIVRSGQTYRYKCSKKYYFLAHTVGKSKL